MPLLNHWFPDQFKLLKTDYFNYFLDRVTLTLSVRMNSFAL